MKKRKLRECWISQITGVVLWGRPGITDRWDHFREVPKKTSKARREKSRK